MKPHNELELEWGNREREDLTGGLAPFGMSCSASAKFSVAHQICQSTVQMDLTVKIAVVTCDLKNIYRCIFIRLGGLHTEEVTVIVSDFVFRFQSVFQTEMEEDNEGEGGAVLLDFTSSFKSEPSVKRKLSLRGEGRKAKQQSNTQQNKKKSDDSENLPSVSNAPIAFGIADVNARLDTLGFEQIDVKRPESVASVVQSVLDKVRESGERSEQYENSAYKSELDCKRLESDNEALRLQVQCLKQDKAALENRVSTSAVTAKKDKAFMDSWVKELQVQIAKLEGQQKGWQAALNRKEAEYDRLQTRMQMLQGQRDRSLKRAFESDSSLPKVVDDGKPVPTLEQLHSAVELASKERIQLLTFENEKLRTTMAALQNIIKGKLLSRGESATVATETSAMPADDNLDVIFLQAKDFNLPVDQLEQNINEVSEKVNRLLNEAPPQQKSCFQDMDREELFQTLQQAKLIIAEQDQLLHMTLSRSAAVPFEHSENDDDIDRQLTEKKANEFRMIHETPQAKTKPVQSEDELASLIDCTPATKQILEEFS